MMSAKHPYYPRNLKLPHYIANDRSGAEILTLFAAVVAVVAIVTWIITGQRAQKFCILRRLVLCWFMICAFIHIVVEGYYAVYHATLAGHKTILGELCKYCRYRYPFKYYSLYRIHHVFSLSYGYTDTHPLGEDPISPAIDLI